MGLQLKNVTKRFDSNTILRDINLNIPEGEFVCIVGKTGCGKTTLLRMIAGQEEITEGEILLDGHEPQYEEGEVGFTFQEYALFPWRTVQKNVEFGLEIKGIPPKERVKIAQKYVDMVHLTGFKNYYPKELSGGMKQRVGIARALAIEPSTLLMDEPFGALDALTRNHMQGELLEVWEKTGKTILFVTHSVDESVFLADRIVMLSPMPAEVQEIISVNIPRPRVRTSPEANRIRDHILGLLMSE